MIARALERVVFSKIGPSQIRHVEPVDYDSAVGLTAEVYRHMRHDFQLLPPVTLHSPVPEVMAGAWLVARESLIAGPVSRIHREAVAAAISQTNQCPFCAQVHSITLHGAGQHYVARAIAKQREEAIPDPELRAIISWALATRFPASEILRTPPFPREHAAEIIGTAVGFHYINRMVHLFLSESPMPLPRALGWLRGPMARIAGAMIGRRLMRIELVPGQSLSLLPAAELPGDLAWAATNAAVAGAYARFAVALEEAGQNSLPEPIRALVVDRVRAWNGEDPGPRRNWVEETVADLEEELRVAARLALLAALAPYQVDDGLVEQFRRRHPGDETLIGAAAWASFAAARRIGTWLS